MEYLRFCFISFILWGTLGLFMKIILKHIPAEFAAMLGYGVGTICIACYVIFRKVPTPLTGFTVYACAIGIMSGFAYLSWYLAMSKGPISVVAPIAGLYPVLTTVLGIIFLHEHITVTRISGIILACLAIILISR